MPETLLTATEVAQQLKVNVETIYALIRDEGLPAAKIAGQWRMRAADVERWIETRIQTSAQASQ